MRFFALFAVLSFASCATPAFATEPPVPQMKPAVHACYGVETEKFDRQFPPYVLRHAFEQAAVEPFLVLWRSANRPKMPRTPDRVTIYVLPDMPVVVAYRSGGCVIAVLAVEREQVLRVLRPSIGWRA